MKIADAGDDGATVVGIAEIQVSICIFAKGHF